MVGPGPHRVQRLTAVEETGSSAVDEVGLAASHETGPAGDPDTEPVGAPGRDPVLLGDEANPDSSWVRWVGLCVAVLCAVAVFASLGPELYRPIMLASRRNHGFPFPRIVTAGLFTVNMLSRIAG